MPRYFFNLIDGKFIVDTEGTLCATPADMRNEAIRTAGHILRDEAGNFPRGLEWQMHVTDEEKNTVLKLRFSAEEPQP
jgi:hypothetical protein